MQHSGSGLIQSGSGSNILAQHGSTKSFDPDQTRIRYFLSWIRILIHNRTFEYNFFQVLKIKI
jgi:hypothetical protein